MINDRNGKGQVLVHVFRSRNRAQHKKNETISVDFSFDKPSQTVHIENSSTKLLIKFKEFQFLNEKASVFKVNRP